MRLLLAIAAAGAAYWYYNRNRRYTGSTTNASDAVDDIHVPPHASTDQQLDAGVKETFPASDPVSVSAEGETAWEKQQRGRG
jgi:type VI protein secretion system component VasK